MVKCSTGCDPLVYKGYGCYCGFLGAGKTLDGIDRYILYGNGNFLGISVILNFSDAVKCMIIAMKKQTVQCF